MRLMLLLVSVLGWACTEDDIAPPGGRDFERDGIHAPVDASPATAADARQDADREADGQPLDALGPEPTLADGAILDGEIADGAIADGAAPDASTPRDDYARCVGPAFAIGPFMPAYDATGARIARHCRGTDHQDVLAVEQVVFIGDGLLAGQVDLNEHPIARWLLAERLAARFGIEPPDPIWARIDELTARPLLRRSGDFIACAAPDAGFGDLLGGERLLGDCLQPDELARRTLYIVTLGARDLHRHAGLIALGADDSTLRVEADALARQLDDALAIALDPARHPERPAVILADIPEPTDGTGELDRCPDAPPLDRPARARLMQHLARLNTAVMAVAVERRVDLGFLHHALCGHGLAALTPAPGCDRGGRQWLDPDCAHLRADGQRALADLFTAIVDDAVAPVEPMP